MERLVFGKAHKNKLSKDATIPLFYRTSQVRVLAFQYLLFLVQVSLRYKKEVNNILKYILAIVLMSWHRLVSYEGKLNTQPRYRYRYLKLILVSLHPWIKELKIYLLKKLACFSFFFFFFNVLLPHKQGLMRQLVLVPGTDATHHICPSSKPQLAALSVPLILLDLPVTEREGDGHLSTHSNLQMYFFLTRSQRTIPTSSVLPFSFCFSFSHFPPDQIAKRQKQGEGWKWARSGRVRRSSKVSCGSIRRGDAFTSATARRGLPFFRVRTRIRTPFNGH